MANSVRFTPLSVEMSEVTPEGSPLEGGSSEEFKKLSIMLQLASERVKEKRISKERNFFITTSINYNDSLIISHDMGFVNINACRKIL